MMNDDDEQQVEIRRQYFCPELLTQGHDPRRGKGVRHLISDKPYPSILDPGSRIQSSCCCCPPTPAHHLGPPQPGSWILGQISAWILDHGSTISLNLGSPLSLDPGSWILGPPSCGLPYQGHQARQQHPQQPQQHTHVQQTVHPVRRRLRSRGRPTV